MGSPEKSLSQTRHLEESRRAVFRNHTLLGISNGAQKAFDERFAKRFSQGTKEIVPEELPADAWGNPFRLQATDSYSRVLAANPVRT
jgi:hypothetical protein